MIKIDSSKRLLTVIFCSLMIIFVLSLRAHAGTAYYVDPTAGSGGNGSYASPWNSIAQVNAKVFNNGDDVYFKVGTTLTMTDRLLVDWHGTEADPVVIGAYYGNGQFGLSGNARPILLGSKTTPVPANTEQGLIHYTGPGYITVKDIHVKNSYASGIFIGELYYSDSRCSTGNIISNCAIQDSGRNGIIMPRSSYSLIEDNLIDGTSQTAVREASGNVAYNGGGVELTGMNNETVTLYNTIRGNTIKRAGEALGIYKGARYTTVENNIVFDFFRVGIYAANARDGWIRNNIVFEPNPADTQITVPVTVSRMPGIWIDSEGHVPSIIKVTGGWEISGNLIAGAKTGIWLTNASNDLGVYQKNNKIFNNRIVDCDRNIWVNKAVVGWTGNEIYNNYSFLFTAGFVHVYADESPIGVTWYGNHYNTAIDGVSGNAATAAVYDDPDLVKTTVWRSLPVDGSVDSTWWAFTSEPADPDPYESALNSANTYGGGTYTPDIAYLMDDATGTTLTDHSGNEAHATLTNPNWTANGLTMSATGQVIAAPMPNMGATWTAFIAFTSTTQTGSDYGKFWYYFNSTVRDWQLERYTSDTEIRSDIGNVTQAWTPTPDVFDEYFHTLMVTYNDTSNTRCLYIDGNFQSCETATFASPTWTGNFYLGGKSDGSRIINATLHAFYIWPNVLSAVDAAALYADYDQMFTDPPARAFNTPTPAAPGPLRRVTTTISTMPMVTTRSQ